MPAPTPNQAATKKGTKKPAPFPTEFQMVVEMLSRTSGRDQALRIVERKVLGFKGLASVGDEAGSGIGVMRMGCRRGGVGTRLPTQPVEGRVWQASGMGGIVENEAKLDGSRNVPGAALHLTLVRISVMCVRCHGHGPEDCGSSGCTAPTGEDTANPVRKTAQLA